LGDLTESKAGGSCNGSYDHPLTPTLRRRGAKIEFVHSSPIPGDFTKAIAKNTFLLENES